MVVKIIQKTIYTFTSETTAAVILNPEMLKYRMTLLIF